MFEVYGKCPSWIHAMRAFGNKLVKMPGNCPTLLWPVANSVLGEEHVQWTKDLLNQYEHLGMVELAVKGGSLREATFYIHHEVIKDIGWY